MTTLEELIAGLEQSAVLARELEPAPEDPQPVVTLAFIRLPGVRTLGESEPGTLDLSPGEADQLVGVLRAIAETRKGGRSEPDRCPTCGSPDRGSLRRLCNGGLHRSPPDAWHFAGRA